MTENIASFMKDKHLQIQGVEFQRGKSKVIHAKTHNGQTSENFLSRQRKVLKAA